MTNKSITATNMPKALLNKKTAKEHFGQFGRITNFIMYPKRSSCIVEYENATSVQNVIQHGYIYDEDEFDVSVTKTLEEKPADEFDVLETRPQTMGTSIPGIYEITRERREYSSPPRSNAFINSMVLRGFLPIKPAKVENDNVPVGLKNEYESVMKKPAYTAEEKFRVLDARDKLLRLSLEKTTDLAKAQKSIGVCPDMCPEKERLMREFQRQVATFELETNSRETMNPAIALKQYSRSSADQESPLSHELRPEPVLQRAMNFLLNEILDLCESPTANISDWFNFVWDRTRSIRKDITQQELCSLDSVELVEQCARFHIYCAGRLVSEDISVFDPRINTENLTKCLQSLKYMYHDLSLKNIACPNEAEFRGYIVLLNLNDSNFLWEIKQLKKNIQTSSEIRFGIEVYLAMDNNNYVKFFNLIRQTNYLNGCILIRYFNQIRTKALNIILKSYTLRSTSINFSISYLTSILGFEDGERTIQFLEYHGFPILHEHDIVKIDKKYYFVPDFPFQSDRCFSLIETKRGNLTSGEIVCGKKIPKFEYKTPHNSFDDNQFLKLSAWKAKDQDYLNIISGNDKNKNENPPVFLTPQSPSPRSRLTISPKLSPDVTSNVPSFLIGSSKENENKIVFENPFIETAKKEGDNIFSTFTVKNDFSAGNEKGFFFGTNIFEKKNESGLSNKQEDVDDLHESKNYEDEMEEIEEEEYIESEDDDDILDELDSITNKSDDIKMDEDRSEDEYFESAQSIKKKISEEELQTLSFQLYSEIVSEVVMEEIKKCSEIESSNSEKINDYTTNLINYFVNEYLTEIVKDELIVNLIKSYRYFMKWKNYTMDKILIKKESEKLIENLPIWMPKSNNFDPITLPIIDNSKIDIKKLIKNNSNIVFKENILNKIEIDILKNNNIIRKSIHYWKLLISIPDTLEANNFYYFINNFLNNLFKNYNTNNSNNYLYFNENRFNSKKINVCIRKSIGAKMLDENEKSNYEIGNNMNGMIFFINYNDSDNFNSTYNRLKIIYKKSHIPTKIPIAIIVCCKTNNPNEKPNEEIIINQLKLLHEYENKFNFNIIIINYINNDINIIYKTLKSGLKFLSKNYNLNLIYSIEMERFDNFMNNYLLDNLWNKYEKLIDSNITLLQITSNINFVITFYNNILIKKFQNLFNHNFENYFALPIEFQPLISFNENINHNLPQSYEYFPKNWKKTIVKKQQNLVKLFNKLKLNNFVSSKKSNQFLNEIKRFINQEIKLKSNRIMVYDNTIKYIELINDYFNNRNYTKNIKYSFIEVIKIISKMKILEVISADENKELIPNEIIYKKTELNCIINSNLILNNELVEYVKEFDEIPSTPALKKRKIV